MRPRPGDYGAGRGRSHLRNSIEVTCRNHVALSVRLDSDASNRQDASVLTDAEMTRILALSREETDDAANPIFNHNGTVAAIAAAAEVERPEARRFLVTWGARRKAQIYTGDSEDQALG
jgi:hypothetical protein